MTNLHQKGDIRNVKFNKYYISKWSKLNINRKLRTTALLIVDATNLT